MTINEWLRQKVKERGMTQQELAEALGVSQTAVYRYLKGDIEPSIKHIKKLAKLFDTPESELLAMKGIKIETPPPSDDERMEKLNKELEELSKHFSQAFLDRFLGTWKQLDEPAMEEVLRIMRFVLEQREQKKGEQ